MQHKKIISLYTSCVILFSTSCSLLNVKSQNKTEIEIENYSKSITNKLIPIYEADLKSRIKKLNSKGLTPLQLKSPDNEVVMLLELSKIGELRNIKTLKKSKHAILNGASKSIFFNVLPVGPPPESCFKEKQTCEIIWKFVLN